MDEEYTNKTIIDEQTFEKLLHTGAIDLCDEEKGQILSDLNEQLKIVRQLESIPLPESINPVIHGNPYPSDIRCGLRKDEWRLFENPISIISQAPVSQSGYIVSPDVPHQRIG